MRILITGAGGQVGRELLRHGRGHELLPLTRKELDITDPDAVRLAATGLHPDAVINAAAYTAVDRAETEPNRAFAVNRDGPANLARACARLQVPLIHISTDYVFDGTKGTPYLEEDPVNPICTYGKSKAAGEEKVKRLCPYHVILRTSWVFSSHGHNFVKTMLKLAREREELKVVDDQYGSPTSASAIAKAIYQILNRLKESLAGTYHLTQPEPTTWYGLARAVVEEGKNHIPLRVRRILPISTREFSAPARRPANSVLDCGKARAAFGIHPVPWRESLEEVVRELVHGA